MYISKKISRGTPIETHTGGEDMRGTMSAMTGSLKGKTGDDFDQAFIDGMIVHHEGAVTMAQAVLKTSSRPELLQLAHAIITAQTTEINQMRMWRTEWFGQ